PLAAGAVILNNHVKRPPMIRRGDPVQIVLDAGPIHIRTAGKALRTVGRGERLLVRNTRSNEVIQAIAENSRTVRVAMAGERG
ncbi:MAG: flagellar basal body P-ring formation chaperone FlgA, partial [Mariprofundaceae bacterium]